MSCHMIGNADLIYPQVYHLKISGGTIYDAIMEHLQFTLVSISDGEYLNHTSDVTGCTRQTYSSRIFRRFYW